MGHTAWRPFAGAFRAVEREPEGGHDGKQALEVFTTPRKYSRRTSRRREAARAAPRRASRSAPRGGPAAGRSGRRRCEAGRATSGILPVGGHTRPTPAGPAAAAGRSGGRGGAGSAERLARRIHEMHGQAAPGGTGRVTLAPGRRRATVGCDSATADPMRGAGRKAGAGQAGAWPCEAGRGGLESIGSSARCQRRAATVGVGERQQQHITQKKSSNPFLHSTTPTP